MGMEALALPASLLAFHIIKMTTLSFLSSGPARRKEDCSRHGAGASSDSLMLAGGLTEARTGRASGQGRRGFPEYAR